MRPRWQHYYRFCAALMMHLKLNFDSLQGFKHFNFKSIVIRLSTSQLGWSIDLYIITRNVDTNIQLTVTIYKIICRLSFNRNFEDKI